MSRIPIDLTCDVCEGNGEVWFTSYSFTTGKTSSGWKTCSTCGGVGRFEARRCEAGYFAACGATATHRCSCCGLALCDAHHHEGERGEEEEPDVATDLCVALPLIPLGALGYSLLGAPLPIPYGIAAGIALFTGVLLLAWTRATGGAQ